MFVTNATFTQTANQFMHKVYGWMFLGLALTAGFAYFFFTHPHLLVHLLATKFHFYALIGAQLGVVIWLTAAIHRMSYATAATWFSIYSVLVGITLTPIFIVYTMASITMTFAITASMFGTMALYGYYTKTDLSGLGNILLMGLYGLIIASLANWYFQSAAMDYYLSYGGVILFTLLTAYDVQKIKQLSTRINHEDGVDHANKIAILGALTLYLDFLNLFLHLLKLMGKKRK